MLSVHLLTRVLVVAILYVVGARVGLHLAFDNRNVTAVWPPTGIAVAALLIFGLRVWPGIAIGALVANLANHAGPATSAAIAVGNTLAPVAAVFVLRRLSWFDDKLERMRDVLSMFLIAGAGAMAISATLGTAALFLTGAASRDHLASVWLVWWVGDAIGVVLFAPFLILASRATPVLKKRAGQTTLLVACGIGVALLVFNAHIPLAYLILVPVVWAALAFEQPGAAMMTVLLSIIAVSETVTGHGPFSAGTPTQDLISLQIFNAVLAFAGLSLASVVSGRRHAVASLRSSEARYRRLFEQATDPIWIHDLDGAITYANVAASAVTGISCERLLAMTMADVVGPDQASIVQRAVRRLLEQADTTSYEIELRGPNGNFLSYEISAVLVRENDEEATGVQLIGRDVTSRNIAEGHLRRQALRDPGTGLPNRTLLAERIEYALAMSQETKTRLALYILDIDHLGRLNQEEGIGAGDALLRVIAHRLGAIIRPSDTVARIGGDEFALLISPIHDEHEAHAFALRLAAEVRAASPDVAPSVAIGVTIHTDEDKDVERLIAEADAAMQFAKRQGPGSVETFRPELAVTDVDDVRTNLEKSFDN